MTNNCRQEKPFSSFSFTISLLPSSLFFRNDHSSPKCSFLKWKTLYRYYFPLWIIDSFIHSWEIFMGFTLKLSRLSFLLWFWLFSWIRTFLKLLRYTKEKSDKLLSILIQVILYCFWDSAIICFRLLFSSD